MHSFRLLVLIATISSLILFSCQDHQLAPPTQPRFRLKEYTFAQSRSSYAFTFTYGPSGKLASYTERFNGGLFATNLTYNAQGQLVRLDRKPSDGNPIANSSYLTYDYNQAGNITTITRYFMPPNAPAYVSSVYTFEYGANAPYPSRQISTFYVDGQVSTRDQRDFSYQNGNAVQIDYKYLIGSSVAPSTVTYQFDDKANPFYNLLGSPDGFEPIYNRNNIVSDTQSTTYDGNGLLTNRVTNIKSDPANQGRSTYSYEQY
ncbi:hypothetical protein [Spirosoma pomorum]